MQIHVVEGSSVSAGQVLLRLDETLVRANLDIHRNSMMAEWARLARLHAMRDGTRQPIFPFEFLSNAELRDMLDN
jgi:HlyD family secretion protein